MVYLAHSIVLFKVTLALQLVVHRARPSNLVHLTLKHTSVVLHHSF